MISEYLGTCCSGANSRGTILDVDRLELCYRKKGKKFHTNC